MRSSDSSVCITRSVMSKPLQVVDQRAEVLAAADGGAQPLDAGGRQLDAFLFGEVEDGLEPQRAVEVDVKIRLGERLEHFEGHDRAFVGGRWVVLLCHVGLYHIGWKGTRR